MNHYSDALDAFSNIILGDRPACFFARAFINSIVFEQPNKVCIIVSNTDEERRTEIFFEPCDKAKEKSMSHEAELYECNVNVRFTTKGRIRKKPVARIYVTAVDSSKAIIIEVTPDKGSGFIVISE